MKKYNEADIKRESELTKEFLIIRNTFTNLKNEENQEVLDNLKEKMRNIFHEIYELRIKLDIYTGNSKEDVIIDGLISYLDNIRLGLVQQESKV